MSDCLFCKIAAGEIPADVVWQDEQAIAFRDISPQAPTHILVIPRQHIRSLAQADPAHQQLLGHLLLKCTEIAKKEKIDAGFRVVVNNGAPAGQSVFHIHLHILGGRAMGWPPG